jgi:hypothetical protein
VVSGLNPASAGPGDVVTVSGKGFETIPVRNEVRVGGVPALVIAAAGDSLQLVVPRLGPGESTRAVEVRVPASSNVGQAQLALKPPADTVEFRFIAEPFTPAAGRVHALLATGLGPAFVLAASGGRTAAERAATAAERLNAAAPSLRTTVGLTLEARGLESSPVIGSSETPIRCSRSARRTRRPTTRTGPACAAAAARHASAPGALVGGARPRPRADDGPQPAADEHGGARARRPRARAAVRARASAAAPRACRARWWTTRARRSRTDCGCSGCGCRRR